MNVIEPHCQWFIDLLVNRRRAKAGLPPMENTAKPTLANHRKPSKPTTKPKVDTMKDKKEEKPEPSNTPPSLEYNLIFGDGNRPENDLEARIKQDLREE